MDMQNLPKITAIIVSYNPDIASLLENIAKIYQQVTHVVIVDNASDKQQDIFLTIAKQYPNAQCECIGLSENQGLGFAHNQGIEFAKKQESEYVLLLDQDSQPTENMVMELYLAAQGLLRKNADLKLAAVGPRYQGEGRHESFFVRFGWLKFQRYFCQQDHCESPTIACDFLISSGSLISIATLQDVGNMDESLFIDHIDTEWFLRARDKGYQSYGVCQAVMEHSLGEKTHKLSFFGLKRDRYVPEHKPFRYYYMFRNSVLLYKRDYVSKLWKWNDFQRLAKVFVLYGFCLGNRKANLGMMLQGVKHGLGNVSGKQDV